MEITLYKITEYVVSGELESIDYISDVEMLKDWILKRNMSRASLNTDGTWKGLDWAVDEEYFEDMEDKKMFLEDNTPSPFPSLVSQSNKYYLIRAVQLSDERFFRLKQ